jgi:ABC-type lipoprotein export system ATPase subunit
VNSPTPKAPFVVAHELGIRLGGNDVVQDVDLSVTAGDQIVLTGRSGSGKTTLLLALAGLLRPSDGQVSWPGLSELPIQRRGQIGMVFQAPSLMPELTAAQNVALPLRLRGLASSIAATSALQALATVGLADAVDVLPAQLSGGQQQRVGVARVLAGGHRLVLADEPTGALDRDSARNVLLTLREGVAAAGGALVLATHDEELADLFAERLMVDEGRLTMSRVRP